MQAAVGAVLSGELPIPALRSWLLGGPAAGLPPPFANGGDDARAEFAAAIFDAVASAAHAYTAQHADRAVVRKPPRRAPPARVQPVRVPARLTSVLEPGADVLQPSGAPALRRAAAPSAGAPTVGSDAFVAARLAEPPRLASVGPPNIDAANFPALGAAPAAPPQLGGARSTARRGKRRIAPTPTQPSQPLTPTGACSSGGGATHRVGTSGSTGAGAFGAELLAQSPLGADGSDVAHALDRLELAGRRASRELLAAQPLPASLRACCAQPSVSLPPASRTGPPRVRRALESQLSALPADGCLDDDQVREAVAGGSLADRVEGGSYGGDGPSSSTGASFAQPAEHDAPCGPSRAVPAERQSGEGEGEGLEVLLAHLPRGDALSRLAQVHAATLLLRGLSGVLRSLLLLAHALCASGPSALCASGPSALCASGPSAQHEPPPKHGAQAHGAHAQAASADGEAGPHVFPLFPSALVCRAYAAAALAGAERALHGLPPVVLKRVCAAGALRHADGRLCARLAAVVDEAERATLAVPWSLADAAGMRASLYAPPSCSTAAGGVLAAGGAHGDVRTWTCSAPCAPGASEIEALAKSKFEKALRDMVVEAFRDSVASRLRARAPAGFASTGSAAAGAGGARPTGAAHGAACGRHGGRGDGGFAGGARVPTGASRSTCTTDTPISGLALLRAWSVRILHGVREEGARAAAHVLRAAGAQSGDCSATPSDAAASVHQSLDGTVCGRALHGSSTSTAFPLLGDGGGTLAEGTAAEALAERISRAILSHVAEQLVSLVAEAAVRERPAAAAHRAAASVLGTAGAAGAAASAARDPSAVACVGVGVESSGASSARAALPPACDADDARRQPRPHATQVARANLTDSKATLLEMRRAGAGRAPLNGAGAVVAAPGPRAVAGRMGGNQERAPPAARSAACAPPAAAVAKPSASASRRVGMGAEASGTALALAATAEELFVAQLLVAADSIALLAATRTRTRLALRATLTAGNGGGARAPGAAPTASPIHALAAPGLASWVAEAEALARLAAFCSCASYQGESPWGPEMSNQHPSLDEERAGGSAAHLDWAPWAHVRAAAAAVDACCSHGGAVHAERAPAAAEGNAHSVGEPTDVPEADGEGCGPCSSGAARSTAALLVSVSATAAYAASLYPQGLVPVAEHGGTGVGTGACVGAAVRAALGRVRALPSLALADRGENGRVAGGDDDGGVFGPAHLLLASRLDVLEALVGAPRLPTFPPQCARDNLAFAAARAWHDPTARQAQLAWATLHRQASSLLLEPADMRWALAALVRQARAPSLAHGPPGARPDAHGPPGSHAPAGAPSAERWPLILLAESVLAIIGPDALDSIAAAVAALLSPADAQRAAERAFLEPASAARPHAAELGDERRDVLHRALEHALCALGPQLAGARARGAADLRGRIGGALHALAPRAEHESAVVAHAAAICADEAALWLGSALPTAVQARLTPTLAAALRAAGRRRRDAAELALAGANASPRAATCGGLQLQRSRATHTPSFAQRIVLRTPAADSPIRASPHSPDAPRTPRSTAGAGSSGSASSARGSARRGVRATVYAQAVDEVATLLAKLRASCTSEPACAHAALLAARGNGGRVGADAPTDAVRLARVRVAETARRLQDTIFVAARAADERRARAAAGGLPGSARSARRLSASAPQGEGVAPSAAPASVGGGPAAARDGRARDATRSAAGRRERCVAAVCGNALASSSLCRAAAAETGQWALAPPAAPLPPAAPPSYAPLGVEQSPLGEAAIVLALAAACALGREWRTMASPPALARAHSADGGGGGGAAPSSPSPPRAQGRALSTDGKSADAQLVPLLRAIASFEGQSAASARDLVSSLLSRAQAAAAALCCQGDDAPGACPHPQQQASAPAAGGDAATEGFGRTGALTSSSDNDDDCAFSSGEEWHASADVPRTRASAAGSPSTLSTPPSVRRTACTAAGHCTLGRSRRAPRPLLRRGLVAVLRALVTHGLLSGPALAATCAQWVEREWRSGSHIHHAVGGALCDLARPRRRSTRATGCAPAPVASAMPDVPPSSVSYAQLVGALVLAARAAAHAGSEALAPYATGSTADEARPWQNDGLERAVLELTHDLQLAARHDSEGARLYVSAPASEIGT
ncbi:hypothetical protein KFE25_006087 [Diacronema lutheri]|uniref:Uncharacterized protein n=1 Tax=Diacronema lutheri TaxID=2081491 RepID=A0A8J5XVY8_DIALT|nr:hypothetical protein KFE25_006087 [Diacronema lutheri]